MKTLIQRWPHQTTVDSLADYAGLTAAGGTFKTYLGRLRTNGLIEERSKSVRLAPAIMGESR